MVIDLIGFLYQITVRKAVILLNQFFELNFEIMTSLFIENTDLNI